jgi:hypothetical protein
VTQLGEEFNVSYDILSQVVDEIKSCSSGFFNIQLDESTDVTNAAQLPVFIRCSHSDDEETGFLLCKPLETTTVGDIFNQLQVIFR